LRVTSRGLGDVYKRQQQYIMKRCRLKEEEISRLVCAERLVR
jgi:hypothetical protein